MDGNIKSIDELKAWLINELQKSIYHRTKSLQAKKHKEKNVVDGMICAYKEVYYQINGQWGLKEDDLLK